MQKNLKTTKTHMFMNGFILRKFRQVTVLLVLFAAQSLYAQSPSSYLAAYKANNTQKVDSVVWKESYGRISAHLYRDDTDTTNYDFPFTPELEGALSSYENSSYMKDGCERVKKSIVEVIRGLKDAQKKALLGDESTHRQPIRIRMLMYKGNIVKTTYSLKAGIKNSKLLEDFILDADRKIRAIKFSGFEKYGIHCFCYYYPISLKDIQKYMGIKSDLQSFIETQDTLWVLDGVVLRDTKGLTIDMLDCSEPYIPLGKALGKEPGEFESLSVITGKKAVEQYGTKETAQVVEIKTKDKSKNTVTVDELAQRMKRARVENLGMGSKLDIDYQAVEDFVRKNPAAYQSLMERFLKDPDSLSKEEAANLYYGFAFTKEYDPLRVDFLTEPRRLYREGKMQEAYDICKKELQLAPVSLSLLWTISQIAGEMGRKEEATKYYSMFMELYNAVTASGNGFSKENALKVIYISDEYAIFRDMMGLKRLKQDYVEKGYDRMTLDRGNKGETITLWFDANLSYDKYHHK